MLLVLIISISCKNDDPVEPAPEQLIVNGDLEVSSWGWWAQKGNTHHNVLWVDQALKLSTEISHHTEFSFWSQSFTEFIPFGKDITLEVRIKGDLEGQGASIALRADDSTNNVLQFETTQGKVPITGEFDWTEFTVTIENVSSSTSRIYIFLVFLPDTTGEVYFDDISILVRK